MRILVVEDDESVAGHLSAEIETAVADLELVVRKSRDAAIVEIDRQAYDLIVCDLRIPTSSDSLDDREEHGFAVFSAARERWPGTPLIFFTGYATTRNISDRLATGGTARLFGTVEVPMVQLAMKDDFAKCIEIVVRFARELDGLQDALQLELMGALEELDVRALAIYGREIGAASATVTPAGGLSGATTARVRYTDTPGTTLAYVFFKLDDREAMLSEVGRYERYVAPSYKVGAFAPTIRTLTQGLRDKAAAFSSLADQARSLFEVLATDSAVSAEVVDQLEVASRPWREQVKDSTVTIGELRRRRAADAKLWHVATTLEEFRQLEAVEIELAECIQHGDLHGENVLVDSRGSSMIIDYGDVAFHPTCYDAVYLELSLLFHEKGPARSGSWPTIEQLERWVDVDYYVTGSPFEKFIRACRGWALASCDSSTVSVVAYVHAIRQLKYSDVDSAWALAVARSAAANITP